MKNKILIAGILVIVSTLAVNVYAVGQQGNSAGTGTQTQQQTQASNQGEGSQIQAQNQEQVQNGSGTGEQVQNQNQEQVQQQNQEQVQAQEQAKQGQINTEQHRNTVSNFVQSLNGIADRETGIGQQVRTIAQQQNQSASATIQAMEKAQTRNKVKTFFLGSDYKNLGALRSEMVQTRNRLEQLNRLMENVQNEGDQTELQNQIQTLEQEQTKIESFINAHEGKFSLFGWLVKLFD
jgi:ATP-dependent Lon protease